MGSSKSSEFELETEGIKDDLKGRSVRGGVATLVGQGGQFFIGTASTVVLARLLVPADFGLIAMVTAVINFASLFKDLGLSMATVQKAKISHEQISTLFWVNVCLSLGIAVVTVGAAPAIALFYGEPRLMMITVALSMVFILGGFTVQHQALLRRQMRFRALAGIQIIAMLMGAVVAVVCAKMGAGYWALVVMQLTSAFGIAIGVWVMCPWRPGLPARRSGVGSMLAFGANLTGFNILNYFARNLDQVLIGKFWGASQVGFYSKAYNLLMLPINQITTPIAAVAIPALSRLQEEPEEYARYYYRAINVIAYITMPLIMSLAALSEEVIRIVLGDQWGEAVRIFKVLAFAAVVQPITNPVGWIYISLGQTHRMFRWGFVSVPLVILSFFVGLPWGAIGVAVSYTICCLTVLTFPSLYWAFRAAPVSVSGWLNSVKRPFVISLCVYLGILVTRSFFTFTSPAWLVLVSGGTGLCIFAILGLAWKTSRREIVQAFNMLRHLRRGSPGQG